MRIRDIRRESRGALLRLAATVDWENVERPPQDVYWELPATFEADVRPRPEAFLTVATLAAMRLGEERVSVDSEICGELKEGLNTAMAWISRWFPHRRPVQIQAPLGCSQDITADDRVAGALLSGGVDSLSLLRMNTSRYPFEHPRRVRICLVYRGVWGRESDASRGDVAERLARARAALQPVADDARVTLIPLYTNLYDLIDGDVPFWQYEFQGAAMAAGAHLFSNVMNVMSIASTWTVPDMDPWGSHPLLDPNYSTDSLLVKHDMSTWTRMDKTRLLAEWKPALEVLRVCNSQPEADTNCGRCEKCVRTKLALLVLGALAEAKRFDVAEVRPDDVRRCHLAYRHLEGDYRELASMLEDGGYKELASVVRRQLLVSRPRRLIYRTDQRYLNGAVTDLYRTVRSR